MLDLLAAGNILVSDRSTGLYIVRPSGAAFTNYGQGCACSANQPCPSLNANGGTLSNSTNQYDYAFEVPLTGSMQVSGFDIYTNSTGGSITRPAHLYLELGNGPASTPFASPVPVNGTFYIGYENSPNGVISNLNAGTNGIGHYRTPVTGNWNQSGLVQRPSWRVNCTGGGALTPSLGNAGLPILNSSYTVTVDGSIPATLAVIVSGLSDSIYTGSPLPVALPGSPGCSVYAAPQVLDLHITNAAGTADDKVLGRWAIDVVLPSQER